MRSVIATGNTRLRALFFGARDERQCVLHEHELGSPLNIIIGTFSGELA
jgi:hypothetical protein